MKLINIFFASIVSLLLSTDVTAQNYQHEGKPCRSQFTQLPARIEYGICTPKHLVVIEYNTNSAYKEYMYTGIKLATEKADWNSAIINFKRAYNVARTEGEREEATRGYKGAVLAKYLQSHPQQAQGVKPYAGWVYVTGVRSQYD